MKFSDIMIISDLDGTFYDSEHKFHPANMEAVEYFKDNGGLFTVATGRVPTSLTGNMEIFRKLTNAPAILCNGGFCYDFSNDKRFFQVDIDRQKATEIIELVREEFPVSRIRCSLTEGEFALGDDYNTDTFEGWTRVSFDHNSYETLNELRIVLENRYKNDFAYMFSCNEILEFQAPDATKGQALKRLRKLLTDSGIATENLRIYAVGDFENDLDLLFHADVACCPDNAIDTVKKAAKVHLCHCDDGAIADLISRIEKGEV